jgi:hypothetical protein
MHTLWAESHTLFSVGTTTPIITTLRICNTALTSLYAQPTTTQQSDEEAKEAEYQFQRNLITCLPILDTLPIPGCIWRRSGEIYKTNEQFNLLVGILPFPSFSLLDSLNNSLDSLHHVHHQVHQSRKPTQFFKIHQLWDPESGLNFLEKFNRIALDDGQKV